LKDYPIELCIFYNLERVIFHNMRVLSLLPLRTLLGKISLNCQERTPYPPIVLYLEKLKEMNLYLQATEIHEQFDISEIRETSLKQAKSQGLFRLHCFLNHSCDPNALVINPKEGIYLL
jgi:hypothetical protein